MEFLYNKKFKANTVIIPVQKKGIIEDIKVEDSFLKLGKQTEFKARSKKEQNIIFYGLKGKVTAESLREMGGLLIDKVKDHEKIIFDFSNVDIKIENGEAISLLVEGIILGKYKFEKYNQKQTEYKVSRISFIGLKTKNFDTYVNRGLVYGNSTNFGRELINEPACVLNPESYEEILLDRYKGNNDVKIKVYKDDELSSKEMNGLIGVGKGANIGPRMIVLEFKTDLDKEHICYVGKGLTFDSGGMNLKGGSTIPMKTDMGGSATTIAAFDILVSMEAKANVTCILVVCENMISKDMQYSTDIIKYPNGLTVEVSNTDAEGRLALADGLLHAQELGATTIIDAATLTGSIVSALGNLYAGVFSNDDKLARDLTKTGEYTFERLWHMPITPEYLKYMKSPHADIRNIALGAPGAGASVAAYFLSRFIKDDKIKWAHLDIAGMSFSKEGKYIKLGTAFGARLLANYVMNK